MEHFLLISDAAKEVRVESHVLRYWEEELHLPIKRNELGHRYYTREDVERFKQIKSMKEGGLQLKAIKMILKDGKLDVLVPENGKPGGNKNDARGNEDNHAKGNGAHTAKDDGTHHEKEDMAHNTREDAGKKGIGTNTDIMEHQDTHIVQESREDKARRLQWLLQQLIRETLQENNKELCREIKESVIKEMDYQFRLQEEREEERDKLFQMRNEEYYRRMDQLLRKKSRLRKGGAEDTRRQGGEKGEEEKGQTAGEQEGKETKRKRHSHF